MQIIVSGKEMKHLDEVTSEHFHVPEVVLMEQAAAAFVEKLLEIAPDSRRILVFCGTGNNGGDGLAIARLLRQKGIEAWVWQKKAEPASFSASAKLQKQICDAYGYPYLSEFPESAKRSEKSKQAEISGTEKQLELSELLTCSDRLGQETWDVVIDALFGTGLSREITGEYADVIATANAMKALKIAVDIPSGVSADTGEVLGISFQADVTVTFSFAKTGHYLFPGSKSCGKIVVADMGITKESFLEQKPKLLAYTKEDLCRLPKRESHSNKGTYGKLLIIAGSNGMAGAAYLSAKAAYRCGSGLVKILTPEENRVILQTALPEAILSVYQKKPTQEQLSDALHWADAVVFGPGVGTGGEMAEVLREVLSMAEVPMVIDADGLNLLAKEPELLLKPHLDIIVTPHLAEMSRLTGKTVSAIQQNLIETARSFAQLYEVICVLKDARTVTAIPYGATYLNLSGNHGMATAGSGDVLSGIIGSLLGQKATAETAASLGVYLHGLAGDAIRKKTGSYGLMAEDITDGLQEIFSGMEA